MTTSTLLSRTDHWPTSSTKCPLIFQNRTHDDNITTMAYLNPPELEDVSAKVTTTNITIHSNSQTFNREMLK